MVSPREGTEGNPSSLPTVSGSMECSFLGGRKRGDQNETQKRIDNRGKPGGPCHKAGSCPGCAWQGSNQVCPQEAGLRPGSGPGGPARWIPGLVGQSREARAGRSCREGRPTCQAGMAAQSHPGPLSHQPQTVPAAGREPDSRARGRLSRRGRTTQREDPGERRPRRERRTEPYRRKLISARVLICLGIDIALAELI